jgi:hypothetical protein
VHGLAPGLAPGADAPACTSTPDLRGLDHQGRPVGVNQPFGDLHGYVQRSEAAQRAIERRLADLEEEVAESAQALDGQLAVAELQQPALRIEEFEAALAAVADGFEAQLRAAADEHARFLHSLVAEPH